MVGDESGGGSRDEVTRLPAVPAASAGNWAQAVVWMLVLGALAAGVALLTVALVPYAALRAIADSYANDRVADAFTPARHRLMVVGLRLLGSGLALSAGILCVARHRVGRWLDDRGRAQARAGVALAADVRAAVATDGRWHWLALTGIVGSAIVLRVAFLFQPMRYDEAYTYLQHASRPLYIGLSNYAEPNNHLLHTLLVHLAVGVLGSEPWAIRLPALVAGILTIPAAYLVARLLYSRPAALVAAAAVASSSSLVEYSTQARGYTLVGLIFLLILALAMHLVETRNSFAWLAFTLLSALGFYAVPVMLYPFGAVVTWIALTTVLHGSRQAARPLLADLARAVAMVVALTALLYAPVLIASGIRSVTANVNVLPQSVPYLAEHLPASFAETWQQWNRDLPGPISGLFVLGFAFASAFNRRLTGGRVWPVLAVLLWCVPVLLVQRVVPFPRVWLFLLPLYLVMAAGGIQGLMVRLTPFGSPVASVLAGAAALFLCFGLALQVAASRSLLATTETGALPDADGLALFLKDRLGPRDRVLAFVPSDAPLKFYFRRHGLPTRLIGSVHPLLGIGSNLAEVRTSPRLWVVVNRAHGQTIELLHQWESLLGHGLGSPVAVRTFPSAALYEIDRGPS